MQVAQKQQKSIQIPCDVITFIVISATDNALADENGCSLLFEQMQ